MTPPPAPLATPLVLMVYNRPRHTAEVLEVLAATAPRRLFVIADGPRPGDPEDAARCTAVRDLVGRVRWPGEVTWDVAPENLGSRRRTQSGLARVFAEVERAIIVEDDCVLDPSFFPFAEELLERYADDPRVAVISALAGDDAAGCGTASYRFSRYPFIWGWATWRRTWTWYEPDLASWPAARETSWLRELLADPLLVAYWRAQFDRVLGGYDTWDYQLTYSAWRHDALSIHPRVNLVKNIGFGPDATHTFVRETPLGDTTGSLSWPIVHPEAVSADRAYDGALDTTHFGVSRGEVLRLVREHVTGTRA